MEGEKSESKTVEKINEVLNFLKKEKKEREKINKRKSIKEGIEKKEKLIKESIEHEDFMYYAFFYGIMAITLSIVLHYEKQFTGNYYELLLIILFPSAICIILFSLFRFFGIVLEDNFWRYISIHGLFIFLFVYIFSVLVYLLFNFSWNCIFKIYEPFIPLDMLIVYYLSFILLFFLVWKIILKKANNFIKNRLYGTKKYGTIIADDRIILDRLILELGFSFFFLAIIIIQLVNLAYYLTNPLYKLDYFLIIVTLSFSIYCFVICVIDFYLIKNKKGFIPILSLKLFKYLFGKK